MLPPSTAPPSDCTPPLMNTNDPEEETRLAVQHVVYSLCYVVYVIWHVVYSI